MDFAGLRGRFRPVQMAALLVVVLLVTTLVTMAVRHDGRPTADVRLHDDSVWVVNSDRGLAGRVNHTIGELDGSVRSGSQRFDLLQSGGVVFVRSDSDSTLTRVDTAALELGEKTQVPASTLVSLGGETLASVDEAGAVRLASVDSPSGIGEGGEVVVEVGRDARVVVGTDGVAHVYSPTDRAVYTLHPDGDRTDYEVTGDPDPGTVQLTTVGEAAVLFDPGSGTVIGKGWRREIDGATDTARVQLPGPAASAVRVATETALLSVPLGGGEVTAVADDAGSGPPTAPAVVAGCTHVAWSGGRREYVRECDGRLDDLGAELPERMDRPLRFRVNRTAVVLNDAYDGDVFVADKNVRTVENWEDVIPPDDENAADDEESRRKRDEARRERTQENSPPTAQDDEFGVRAGRGTRLAVIDNDTDPDGDTLVAELVGPQPAGAEVRQTDGGLALQIDVPPDTTGVLGFRYRITDGRGGEAEANVEVTVRQDAENSAPEARVAEPVRVARGRGVDLNALAGWTDPDGDDVYAVKAETEVPGDTATLLPNGRLTFRDGGQGGEDKRVSVTVSDGRVESTTDLPIRVDPVESATPIANPDHARALVGRAVELTPLANDIDPTGAGLRLAKVERVAGAEVTSDPVEGTISFVASRAGTYHLDYLAANGPGTASSTIRVDVDDPSDDGDPPVTADDIALLPAGSETLVDVLANDSDPAGGVLVVKAVEVPVGSGVTVGVVDNRVLRVSDSGGLTEPTQVRYTVSNGRATAEGYVQVVPVKPPAKPLPPVAEDDEVTVRAGDHVTIPVMANDSHPDGGTLSLAPELVQEPDPAAGTLFLAGDTLRFQAGPEPTTAYAIYEVMDSRGQATAAQVTIHVLARDEESNQAPRPKPLTARVLAGATARIAVPLDGIDPDGDSVRLDSVVTAPTRGRVSDIDGNVIEYVAAADAVGDDSFTYRVVDAMGAVAIGQITVGVAPANEVNHPPAAIPDRLWVRPDRALTAAVLLNDTDPDGDELTLLSDGLQDAEALRGEADGNRVEMLAPHDPGAYSLLYTVEDARGASAVGEVRVAVDPDAPLKVPVGRDDVVRPEDIVEQDAVTVPILANDEDPDGSIRQLGVTVDSDDVGVNGDGTLRVPVLDEERTIFYRITDADGLSGGAFVHVPGRSSVAPVLRPGSRIETRGGETVDIVLGDHVVTRPGTSPRISDDRSVTAPHSDGSPLVADATTLRFTSPADYFGETFISFEVTDGAGPDDPEGRRATLALPITVKPSSNQPPTFTGSQVAVAPGETARLELAGLAEDPDDDDLSFQVGPSTVSEVAARLDGTTLVVEASPRAETGGAGALEIVVDDGEGHRVTGAVSLRVTTSNRPLAVANDDVVTDGAAGRASVVDVLANDINPFDEPLRLLSVDVVSGNGTATSGGDAVTVTPAAGFSGELLAEYRIADATGDPRREVTGRIRVQVRDRPDAPSAPSVVEVRNATAVLTWTAPSSNGSPITNYVVRGDGGFSQVCAATTCTLTGLRNGQGYRFTVLAVNEVGESDPSAPSEVVTPDAKPDTPQPPRLMPGDKQLDVVWAAPGNEGTPIRSYTLEITPAGPSGSRITGVTGTTTTISGLENGVSYRVRVQALNDAPDPSEFSAYSVAVAPAGAPLTPAAPSAQRVESAANGGAIDISWTAPDDNGAAIQTYDVLVYRGGSRVDSRPGLSAATTSLQFTGLDTRSEYSFAVVAHNAMGASGEGARSTPLVAYGKPGQVSGVSVAFADASARVSFSPGQDNGSAITSYRVNSPQGASASCASSPCTVSGLTNGTNYTFTVTAENAAGAGPVSAATATGSPFGPPRTPSINANSSGTTVSFSWNSNAQSYANGRQITSMDVTFNGGGVSNNGSFTRDVGYSATGTLTVRVCASEGGCSEATKSASTGAQPEPQLSISQGSGSSVNVTVANAPAGRREVRCWNADNASRNWDSNYLGNTYVNVPSNGTFSVTCPQSPKPGTFALEFFEWRWSSTIQWR
ncbi:MAG: Ig-like domain-containing protein [Dietzia sp.]